MRTRLITLAATTTTAALVGISATCLADPAQAAPVPAATGVHGQARIDGQSVLLHTDLGSLRVVDRRLEIVDPNSLVLGAIPLTVVKDGTAYPVDAHVDGENATLTPRFDQARPINAEETPIAAGDSPEDRLNTAMGNVNNELTVALAVGTLLGAIIGAPLGCVALGLLGGGAAGVATGGLAAIPAAAVGCLTGAVTGAGMGVVVFNLLIGVPALIASAVHFYNVMTAPPAVANG
ncbi:hypothetical protein [Nocardia sp. NPDC056000]|uniref:hypothetical protein n=1 Tax=Nocardia sp. NPDC056000 TaxID=3345674 RepID=UPI0035D95545